jgi:hypothetical protein
VSGGPLSVRPSFFGTLLVRGELFYSLDGLSAFLACLERLTPELYPTRVDGKKFSQERLEREWPVVVLEAKKNEGNVTTFPAMRPEQLSRFFFSEVYPDTVDTGRFLQLCDEVAVLFESVHGFIDLVDKDTRFPVELGEMLGGMGNRHLEDGIPYVGLCNWFGPTLVKSIGRRRLVAAPWLSVRELEGRIVRADAMELPTAAVLPPRNVPLRQEIALHLGAEHFASQEWIYAKKPRPDWF